MLSVVLINSITKSNLGRRELTISYTTMSRSVIQGRSSNATGTWRQKLKQRPQRNVAQWFAYVQPSFSYYPGPHVQRWHHPSWDGLFPINHDSPGQYGEVIFSIKVPSS